MNLSKNQPHRHIAHIGFSIVAYVPDVVNYLVIMKKLLRFIGIISLVSVSLAVYSFGNAMVEDCAMIDLERTINYIESSLLGLLCVAFISLTIMFWREDL
jgi:hypothetical protein